MPDPLAIVEILDRSEQGTTRPFLCRCDDERLYFVKGRGAGHRGLLSEWLTGHLAKAFGLPVPEFAVAHAPQGLVDLHPEGRDLGWTPLFASQRAAFAQDLTVSQRNSVLTALRRDVLVFDWWVRNGDRTLTALGGNPNLLWVAGDRGLVVIDHNLAFDLEFDAAQFAENHAFSDQIPFVFQDLVEPLGYAARFQRALAVWPDACNNAPKAWWFVDEEQTVPTDFDPVAALAMLNRCTTQEFWRLTP